MIREKPIGRTLEEGRKFARFVKFSSCKVFVPYILRYNETYRRAAQLIRISETGAPTVPTMDKVYSSFETVLRADGFIRTRLLEHGTSSEFCSRSG